MTKFLLIGDKNSEDRLFIKLIERQSKDAKDDNIPFQKFLFVATLIYSAKF